MDQARDPASNLRADNFVAALGADPGWNPLDDEKLAFDPEVLV